MKFKLHPAVFLLVFLLVFSVFPGGGRGGGKAGRHWLPTHPVVIFKLRTDEEPPS